MVLQYQLTPALRSMTPPTRRFPCPRLETRGSVHNLRVTASVWRVRITRRTRERNPQLYFTEAQFYTQVVRRREPTRADRDSARSQARRMWVAAPTLPTASRRLRPRAYDGSTDSPPTRPASVPPTAAPTSGARQPRPSHHLDRQRWQWLGGRHRDALDRPICERHPFHYVGDGDGAGLGDGGPTVRLPVDIRRRRRRTWSGACADNPNRALVLASLKSADPIALSRI